MSPERRRRKYLADQADGLCGICSKWPRTAGSVCDGCRERNGKACRERYARKNPNRRQFTCATCGVAVTAAAMASPVVRERPILFSAPMVRAILAGRKTQTRRIVNEHMLRVSLPRAVRPDFADVLPGAGPPARSGTHRAVLNPQGAVSVLRHEGGALGVKPGEFEFVCQYADGVTRLRADRGGWEIVPHPSQRLWVKETFWHDGLTGLAYRADGESIGDEKWKPSIFMRRELSRITLEVTEVRVQRLNEISESDATAEGVDELDGQLDVVKLCARAKAMGETTDESRVWFAELWDSINSERAPWSTNPWVWAVSFRVVSQ